MGFTEEDLPDQTITILDCVMDSWATFMAISTQWRCGPSGPIGLDLTPLTLIFDTWDIDDKDDRRQILTDLKLIEGAALEQMANNQSA